MPTIKGVASMPCTMVLAGCCTSDQLLPYSLCAKVGVVTIVVKCNIKGLPKKTSVFNSSMVKLLYTSDKVKCILYMYNYFS